MTTVHLSSSLRTTPPEVTRDRARALAKKLGITRVTDTTRLDRVGVPVYASIRPTAARGSLCVNAGKGLHPIEAEVGAYMEAIEFALAEPGASPRVTIVRATARDVLDGRERPEAILDLCPKLGVHVRLDAPLDCVEAEDIATGERALVPAELVFLPYRPRARFKGLFGTTSNGLASGNSLREATVHGLCEVIERDVCSFEAVRDTSAPVDLDTVEGPARALVETIRAADLDLFVRSAKNDFGLPYFFAVIHDRDSFAPHLLNGGFGCHAHRSVAFVRAVAEAAQSRLTFIHGGRDDLVNVHDRFRGWSARRKRAFVEGVVARASRGEPIAMRAIDDHSATVTTIERCEAMVLARLGQLGFGRVYRVAFSAPNDALQVVRVIVPRLEMFHESVSRVGARLRDHARANPDALVLFVGPTLATSARARLLAKPFRLRRPIRRHDVDDLVAATRKARKKPGVLVIVDGVFHDTLAVGHAEIRDALAAGWRVWGLSSMGAIRAREMMHLGMRGYGRVFDRFCGDDDFQDDEVALLHEPAAPYRAVSEPLVHLRAAIDHLVAREIVSADDARAVIADLKSRWYGERTVNRARQALKQCARADAGAIDRELREMDRFRLKTLDLVRFLEERPFASADASGPLLLDARGSNLRPMVPLQ